MSAPRSEPLRVLSHFPAPGLRDLCRGIEGVEFQQVPTEGPLEPGVQGEVLLTFAWGSPNLGEVVEHGVRWVHTIGTGVDGFPFEALGDRVFTCARGSSAVPIAEWTLAMMLAFEKDLPDIWLDEPPAVWNRAELGGLAGGTLALVGLGAIAQEVAKRALPFGMRVRALRRTDAPSPIPEVEVVRSLDALVDGANHVVVAAAATPRTRHLIDADALARMREGVHLVNVARGALVDQEALRAALDRGHVARASLDVCEPEPLPAGHWLYAHPRVRLSAHVSWAAPGAIDVILGTFRDNLRRYLAGEPLAGRVDPKQGY